MVAGGIILGVVVMAATKPGPGGSLRPGQAANALPVSPEWELADLHGKIVKSAEFNGKVVIFNFWATWCPPCRAEIPGFVELQKKHGKNGLAVIGVCLDQGGADGVKKFVEKEGINYRILMGTEAVLRAYGGVEAIPTTFIINRESRIVGKHEGFADREVFEQKIQPLLGL